MSVNVKRNGDGNVNVSVDDKVNVRVNVISCVC